MLLKPGGGPSIIPSIAFERELIGGLTKLMLLLKTIKVELPIFLFLTLVGVEGYSMATGDSFYKGSVSIDREVISLPEVIIENYEEKAEKILKPCFDSVWNACGFSESRNYDKDDKWTPK